MKKEKSEDSKMAVDEYELNDESISFAECYSCMLTIITLNSE